MRTRVKIDVSWVPALALIASRLGRDAGRFRLVPAQLLLGLLALLGFLAALWAEKFDHNAAVTNFVIAPLSLLSGTFYVIDNLAPAFQAISRANPFFYVISGFRYGFLGESDIGNTDMAVSHAALGLLAFNLVFGFVVYRVLKSGWKLKD